MPLGKDSLETDELIQLKELALDCGFSYTGELNPATLKLRPEVRDACAADKCGAYGKNWACPPACGSLEECGERMRPYTKGLILQTSNRLEDSLDYETMQQTGVDHGKNLIRFQHRLKDRLSGFLLLGGGACKVCESCGCPDTPCRFPGKKMYSMEAMGLVVSDVCSANKLPYYYGPNTITFVGCLLF
jgi:predicted metal-binding protein